MIRPTTFEVALFKLQKAVQTGVAEKMYKSEAAALLEMAEAYIGLMKAAQEMLEVLATTPDGPLWPGREEMARGYIGWHQRLERAKDACPIKVSKNQPPPV